MRRYLRRRWRLLAGIASVALVVWVAVEIVLAGRGILPVPPSGQPILLQGGRVQGGNHVVSSRSWRFAYDRGEFSADGTTGTLDGIHDGIVFRKGRPYLRLDAQHVSLNVTTLDFTAIGLVHIAMIDDPANRSFDTDEVEWTNYAKMLRMRHRSYVHVGGQTLTIESISVDFDKKEVRLGRIEGAIGVP